MKSRVISFPDITKIRLSEEQRRVDRSNHQQSLEEEMDFVRRKYSVVVNRAAGEAVEEGDTMVLNVSCGQDGAPAKFQKEGIGIRLGKNFYDKTLEQALPGKKVGETAVLSAGPEGSWPVTVTICSAQHTALRELTEEDYREEGRLNDVEVANEEEYRAFLEESITDSENFLHFYDYILDDLAERLVSESAFLIDEEELNTQREKWIADFSDMPDHETEEEDGFIEYVQDLTGSTANTREELTVALKDYFTQSFKYNLILLALAEGAEVPDENAYEAMKAELLREGYSEEELAEMTDYESFVKNQKLEIGQDILRGELEKQYTS